MAFNQRKHLLLGGLLGAALGSLLAGTSACAGGTGAETVGVRAPA